MKTLFLLIFTIFAFSMKAQLIPMQSLNANYFNKTAPTNISVSRADIATTATNLAGFTRYDTYTTNAVAWTADTNLYSSDLTTFTTNNVNDTNSLFAISTWGTAAVTNGLKYTAAGGAFNWTNTSGVRVWVDSADLVLSNSVSPTLYISDFSANPTITWSVDGGASPAGTFLYGTNGFTITTNLFLRVTHATLNGWFDGNGFKLTNTTDSLLRSQVGATSSPAALNSVWLGGAGNGTTTGSRSVAIGYETLKNDASTGDNYAFGYQVLHNNTTGFENVGIGFQALYNNTVGEWNTAIQDASLFNNTSGIYNTAIGAFSLFENRTGNLNIALGIDALRLNTNGNKSIGIGYRAGYNAMSGGTNIYIGNEGVATDTNIIRIGTPGAHTAAHIAGQITGNGGGLTNLNDIVAGDSFMNMRLSTNSTPAIIYDTIDVTKTRVFFEGDSWMAGVSPAFSWTAIFTNLPNWRGLSWWTNCAVLGESITTIDNQWTNQILPFLATGDSNNILFLHVQGNGLSDITIGANITLRSNYVKRAQAAGVKVVENTIPPRGDALTGVWEVTRNYVNNFIYSSTNNYAVIDAARFFYNCYDGFLFDTDTLHPSIFGVGVLAIANDHAFRTRAHPPALSGMYQAGTNLYMWHAQVPGGRVIQVTNGWLNVLALNVATVVTDKLRTSGAIPRAVTVGASPFEFVNPHNFNIECWLDDGAALFSVSKNGVEVRSSLSGSSGQFTLQPTNRIVVTYPVTAPTFLTNSY